MPRKILLITNYMIEIQNIIIDRRIDVSQESLASKQASKPWRFKTLLGTLR